MREEFHRLEDLLSNEENLSPEKAKEILVEATQLFEKLKDIIFTGTPEERTDIIRLMTKLNTLIRKQFQTALKNTGLTEEQFRAMSENPQNFTPEQWDRMQETKSMLSEKSKELSKVLDKADGVLKNRVGGASSSNPETSGDSSNASKLRPKRKNWLKS